MDERIEDYKKFEIERTGSHGLTENYKTITYPFDKYLIKVQLTPYNEFVGITEIEIDKDFLSYARKVISKGFHDVDEFYTE